MNSSSRYKQQADSLRRKERPRKVPQKPVQFNEIMQRKDVPPGTYLIREKTVTLSPRTLPKTGDLVLVEKGVCPVGLENNIILVVTVPDGSMDIVAWRPSFAFYVGQIVSFWDKETQYDYQIQLSDDDRLGKFVLVNTARAQAQPGRSYRTTKNGKKR